MTVIHFDENNTVDVRYMWASAVSEVVEKKGGSEDDYAVGDYPVGSTRDPETGEITPYAPPTPTTAELAATLSLPAASFWIALHVLLIDNEVLTPADDVQAHVLSVIDSAVSAEALTDLEGMSARILVRTATTFVRADPDRPGLLDGIGALVGLTSGEIDALFVAAAGEEGT